MSHAATLDAAPFIDEPHLSKTKKKDLMVFSEMSSTKIIRRLAFRHRVGLWALGTFTGWALYLHIPHYVMFWYSVFFGH